MGDIGSPTHQCSHVLGIKTWCLKHGITTFNERKRKKKTGRGMEVCVERGGGERKKSAEYRGRQETEEEKREGE